MKPVFDTILEATGENGRSRGKLFNVFNYSYQISREKLGSCYRLLSSGTLAKNSTTAHNIAIYRILNAFYGWYSCPYSDLFSCLDGKEALFQGDIIMTREIRDSLNSRGILVPPKRMAKPQSRRKRAIMRVSRGRDLRWLVGSSGKREVPYYITSSNSEHTN